jgi:hypothetical protein
MELEKMTREPLVNPNEIDVRTDSYDSNHD